MRRRDFLEFAGVSALGFVSPWSYAWAQSRTSNLITKVVPSTKVSVPVIGMGTWITFNVGNNMKLREHRTEVLREFVRGGGGMIDSSPMYGSSEEVIGYCLNKLDYPKRVFSATKVWTSSTSEGREQIEESYKLWGVNTFDLFQIHNLQGWKSHLKTLLAMQEKGRVRHVGITTSHGRRHDLVMKVMKEYPIDFVQLTYNMMDREVEKKILPLAQEREIAVIANRPYRGGSLIDRLKPKSLPAWAEETDCDTWPKFLLKFIVSHPAITCAIPATSNISHMKENMQASRGRLPKKSEREKMLRYVAEL